MKKSLIILICCIFFVISFFPPNSLADTRIRVGVYQNRPLLFKDSDGNVKGIFADILEYVAAKEGWAIEYKSDSWAQCLKDLQSGKLDVLGAIAYSEQRDQMYDFTYENIISNWGQIYTGKLSNIESILDFKGKKIAVLQNDIYYKNLSQLVKKLDIECRFTEAFDYEAVLELVEAGKCDAGLVNYLYGHQYDRKYNINRSSIILSPQKIHFAVPKGKNRKLINTLDMYLRNLKKDKSSIYYQSLSRWIGVDSKQMDPIWIYAAGAGAAGIILLVLILNLILRSQVSKRTQELDAKNQALIYEIERRKNVEAALQKNEREYRSVFENTGTATFIVEEDMTISKVNEKAAKMIGYPKLEIEGKMKTSDFISRKDLKRLTGYHYDRRSENGPHPSEYEFNLIDRNANTINAFIQISVIPKTKKSIASLVDITSRVKAEEALKHSEEKYRNIIENIEEGFFELDLEGNLTFFNSALSKITGYSREELVGLNYRQYSSPKTSKTMFEVFTQIFSSKQPIMVADFEIESKDGSALQIDLSAAPILDNDGRVNGFRGLMRNVSERKKAELETIKLEKKLQQAQKMNAIGTLAGGVAHDLNNILSGIVSYPDLILMDLPENSPLIEPILTIQESGKKAAAIVQDLLTLARRGVSVSEVVNLNDIIDEYLTSPQLGKLKSYHPEVEIKSNLDPALLNIMGSPVHLSKTVMNLVSNAAEAIPAGGKVNIIAENKYIDAPISGYEDVAEGDYVVLTISDNGIGIAPDEINRIFEPFYTKKKMGRSGTGLGMAVVWGTVKDHKGYIHVKSDEGKGTTIKLFFPVTRKPFRRNEIVNSFESYRGEGESILVVDDVKEQREIASKLLAYLGYSVQTVSSGKEAIEHIDAKPTDLVVLDMLMPPGIDGLETYERIISKHPGQKAIIASGFSETNRVKKAQSLGAGSYVKKPYTLEKIGLAVKAELKELSSAA
jgi:PAS domain S-box-containing protein